MSDDAIPAAQYRERPMRIRGVKTISMSIYGTGSIVVFGATTVSHIHSLFSEKYRTAFLTAEYI